MMHCNITTYGAKWLAGLTSSIQQADADAFQFNPRQRNSFSHTLSLLFPID